MPSKLPQLNVRMDPETEALVKRLIPAITEAIGLKVTQSDLFRLGVQELRKKYLTDEPDPKPLKKGK